MGAYLDQTGYPRAMALPLWLSYVARCWQWEGKVVSGDKSLANSANLLRMTRLIHGYVQVLEQKSGLTS
jgi:hypothetical protein